MRVRVVRVRRSRTARVERKEETYPSERGCNAKPAPAYLVLIHAHVKACFETKRDVWRGDVAMSAQEKRGGE